MNISSCKIGKYSTNKSGMKLPIVIPKELKMDVQRDIYNFLDKPIELKLISLADETVSLECEIDNTRKLKNSFKVTFSLEDEQAKDFLPVLYKFDDMTLGAKLEVDAEEQQDRLSRINHEQRKKIYALLNDIDSFTGQGVESIKKQMKFQAAQSDNYESIRDMFSLSDCDKDVASEFIEFLIDFCFQHGIELSEDPKELFDHIEKYIYYCLKNKVCCICGKEAEVYSVDNIKIKKGSSKTNNIDYMKVPLCSPHYTKANTVGWQSFSDEYKIKGIKYKIG